MHVVSYCNYTTIFPRILVYEVMQDLYHQQYQSYDATSLYRPSSGEPFIKACLALFGAGGCMAGSSIGLHDLM